MIGVAPTVYFAAMGLHTTTFEAGTRVRVVQQLPQGDRVWTTATEGTVVRYRQAKTGSWFAHGRDDKLWLDRLELRLDDGELVTLNLDHYSVVEEIASAGDAA